MRCGYKRASREDIEETQEERKVNAPMCLPSKRPRALTYVLPSEAIESSKRSCEQQTFDQLQSILVGRLPRELRDMIWFKILGGRLLHIVRAPKRLLAIDCIENFGPELETRGHSCWGYTTTSKYSKASPGFYLGPHHSNSETPANLLPLLQTCRVIYSEAISILYKDNVFDINHFDTFSYLQRTVLPQRLCHIRTLNFSWKFERECDSDTTVPYNLDTWRESCSVLATFKKLQELSVHLSGYNGLIAGGYHSGREYRWRPVLEPLSQSQATNKFVVFLPWGPDECEEAQKACNYPFILSTRQE